MAQFTQLKSLILKTIEKSNQFNFIFIRHGETFTNKSIQLAGFYDDQLTAKGKQQANALFQSVYPFKQKFNKNISSEMSRARKTCEISLGYPNQSEYIVETRLKEINMGDWEKRQYSDLTQEEKNKIFQYEFKFPNGESWQELHNRSFECLQTYMTETGTYLIYGHGGIMSVLCGIYGKKHIFNNTDVVGFQFEKNNKIPKELLFMWQFPDIQFKL